MQGMILAGKKIDPCKSESRTTTTSAKISQSLKESAQHIANLDYHGHLSLLIATLLQSFIDRQSKQGTRTENETDSAAIELLEYLYKALEDRHIDAEEHPELRRRLSRALDLSLNSQEAIA